MDTKNTSTTPAPASAQKDPKYVGPKYKNGIVMPDGRKYAPAAMTAVEAKDFVKKYPEKATWWKSAV